MSNCVMDNRFTLKIAKAGYVNLINALADSNKRSIQMPDIVRQAPEFKEKREGSAEADMPAAGRILQRIIADYGTRTID